MMKANPLLLEPLMSVEIDIPQEFQGAIIGGITVGIYMIEHSAPEIIEASVEQLGSEQALIAVSTMQSLLG